MAYSDECSDPECRAICLTNDALRRILCALADFQYTKQKPKPLNSMFL